jgi:hypothetical protein
MTEACLVGVAEVYSQELLEHVHQHASSLYPRLMKRDPGSYHGRISCCGVYWRAARTDHGPKRRQSLTIRFIDINLPDGHMLFGW